MKVVNVIAEGNVSVTARRRIAYVIDILNNHPICIESTHTFKTETPGYFDLNLKVDAESPVLNVNDHRPELTHHKIGQRQVHGISGSKAPGNECDFFGSIFFHLSRYEELSLKQTDYLENKLDFENQLFLIRNKLEKVAVVDEIIRAIIETLTKKEKDIPRKITLSHDIDYIEKFKNPFSIIRKVAGHFIHRKSLKGLPYLFKSYRDYLLKGQDGFDTFEWMLSHKSMDKTIYFLVGGEHKEDNQYSLTHPVFKKALKLARERNYRIGIHPSYESWDNEERMQNEKEKLEAVVGEEIVRSRQHFLNFDVEKTPKLLQSQGIREDSSLGYARHVGYRCGTGFPYRLYDFENEKAFDVVENPLVFMDSAWLFESQREKKQDFDFMKNCNGSLNFHNSMFDEMEHRNIDFKKHYLDLLVES